MAKKSALEKIEAHEKLCRIMQKQTFEQIKEMRERIHKKFSNIFPSWKLAEFEKMFGGPDRKDKWQKAIEYTNNLDEIRKQNISNSKI